MNTEALYRHFLDCGMQVCTDTRNIRKGDMFFALKGEHFNGNAFAFQALEKGAAVAVVDEDRGFNGDTRILMVDNVLQAMQDLARLHRKLINVRLIAIGGSNGKTTTKELIVSVLSGQYSTHYTHGNLNNHIGLPLTLLQLRKEHQIAVVEMGANREGDIRELCAIAEPELGLITNIGKEHLEGFGSMEGVARAESELFDYLIKTDGHAFVNADDAWLSNMGKRIESKTHYGKQYSGFEAVVTAPEISFNKDGLRWHSPLMGEHNLQNIMAAVAVAEYFKMEPAAIRDGIAAYKPQNNRSQWVQTDLGNTILLDAYNANPSSVEMALRTFSELPGQKVILLGDMFELGAYEAEEHRHMAALSAGVDNAEVVLVGKAFAATEPVGDHVHRFADKSDAEQFLLQKKYAGVSVLIKGSRGMKMEDFLNCF